MKKMRDWVFYSSSRDALYKGDTGLAVEEVRRREAAGEILSERDIEDIAHKYHCRLSWVKKYEPDGLFSLLHRLFGHV